MCTCAFSNCLVLCICCAYVPALYVFFWREAVQRERTAGGMAHPASVELRKGSSAQFGPLYGNLESVPSGSIIIMEDDTPDVLIRYVGRGSAGTGRRQRGASLGPERRTVMCVQPIKHFVKGSGADAVSKIRLSTLASCSLDHWFVLVL